MIQVLKMFGYLPNMLEITVNPCFQGCTYCYAKTWKQSEHISVENIINKILKEGSKSEGLLSFLIKNRSPITLSNRSDLMCSPNWREVLYSLKKLGFPIYLETKLNKDYKDLAQILDTEKDTIYQTITGYNNKHEEVNILTAEEKIEAAKWLNEHGLYHILAINPFLPDKITTNEIKKMIEYIKPHGFVMRDYHKTSRSIDKHLFMPEFDKKLCFEAREEIRTYCIENNIVHDIDWTRDQLKQYPELNLRLKSNERSFDNNYFVDDKSLNTYTLFEEDNGLEVLEFYFDDFIDFYEKEIQFFRDCIFKRSDYSITNGKSNFKWGKERFDIYYFLNNLWNNKKITNFHYFGNHKDDKDNLVYLMSRQDLI